MSGTGGPLLVLPTADTPIRNIALQRLKLNVPVLVAFYVWIHSDFYTYILKRNVGIKVMQVLLNIWEVGQDSRIKNVTSEVARKERASNAFEWVFETPFYAILVFNILQALYALYTNATATQLLKLDTNHSTGTAPVAAPAPGPNPSTRVRASLTRAIPDSPNSHPSFPTTMSSESLRRRLTRQSEKSPQGQQLQDREVQRSSDNTVAQASQNPTRPANTSSQSAPGASSTLPLSRLLQTQSKFLSSQRPSLGVLAPGPSPYLSRSGLESPTQTTGFSLPTPAQPQPTDDELFGSFRRATSSRRRAAAPINVDDLGGVSTDALQSYRARHQLVQDGTLGRSTVGSAVDRARALESDAVDGGEELNASDPRASGSRQMITA